MVDPDLQMRGGPGHPDPEIREGGGVEGRSQKIFSALRPSVWSKNKGEGIYIYILFIQLQKLLQQKQRVIFFWQQSYNVKKIYDKLISAMSCVEFPQVQYSPVYGKLTSLLLVHMLSSLFVASHVLHVPRLNGG